MEKRTEERGERVEGGKGKKETCCKRRRGRGSKRGDKRSEDGRGLSRKRQGEDVEMRDGSRGVGEVEEKVKRDRRKGKARNFHFLTFCLKTSPIPQ